MTSINKEEYRALIEFLAAQRQLKGLNQTQLSQLIGKPQSFVSKVESCERRLDIAEFMDICFLMNVDFDLITQTLKDVSRYSSVK